ncbi:MAG: hypothetical protein AAF490_17270 [Chloroflexota bacterium]
MIKMHLFWPILIIFITSGCQSLENPQQHILYMGWDENSVLQLFTFEVATQESEQLTRLEDGISEYQLAGNQREVAYVSNNQNQISQIWLMTLNGRFRPTSNENILSCENSNCAQLVWAPDGRRLIYEKRSVENGAMGQPSLWWLDTETGNTIDVLPDVDKPASAASISPDGKWLTYNVSSEERVYGFNFENGRFIFIQGAMGTPTVWHPTNDTFLINDLNIAVLHGDEGDDHQEHSHDFAESVHLFNVEVLAERRNALTEAAQVDDASPTYSPDGEWILFGRKLVRTNTGRQLWLMRADGSEKQALTDSINIHHSVVSWSGNGRFILYQMIDLLDNSKPPSLWMMEIESGEKTRLIENGIQGRWIQ